MPFLFLALLPLVVLLGLPVTGFAQATAAPQLESKLAARKVVKKDGKEAFEPATVAQPGDIIEYASTYTNKAKAPVTKLEATLPIPATTEIILDSIKPAGARASTDGIAFAAIPLTRKVKQPDGKEVEQPVPLREYRSLRWSAAEVAGEKSATFVARVKVLQDAAPNAQPQAPPAK